MTRHDWRDRRGGIAIIAALLAPLFITIVGFGIDYSYAYWINQRLNEAADAGALAAVSQSAANVAGGYANTNLLQMYGTNVFQTNVKNLPVSVTPNLVVSSNGTGGATSNMTYTASVPTFFSGVFGMRTMGVNGGAQATGNPITYINYYIIVDISQSMGIGATATDMQNLYNRTQSYNNGSDGEPGCVFGCHAVGYNNSGQLMQYTNEYLAHNVSPSITLRIDSAVAAIQSIISAAQTAAGTTKNIQIGLYTMSQNPNNGVLLTTISKPSSDYSTLKTYASGIDLGGNNSGGIGDTDFSDQLTQFNNIVPAQGTGATSSSPKNYVFIISDGVADVKGNCTDGHCTSAFDPSLCNPLKTKATVGVIYTTYLPVYHLNNQANGLTATYSDLVAPFASQIVPNMQACSTDPTKWYYEAKDGPQIAGAMQALFASSQSAVRITK